MKLITSLFAISILLIATLPQEVRLGSSYKLVYFHVPIAFVTIFSILLLPLFHHKLRFSLVKGLSISSTIYALLHLSLSAFFMQLAWGNVVFSEPKFSFSLVLFVFALTHTLLCFLDSKIARVYSFLSWIVVPYFYSLTTTADFQLHPERVQMPLFLYAPYVLTFPLLTLVYVETAKGLSSRLKS